MQEKKVPDLTDLTLWWGQTKNKQIKIKEQVEINAMRRGPKSKAKKPGSAEHYTVLVFCGYSKKASAEAGI